MRIGDFSLSIVAHDGSHCRETDDGHVLMRHGQVYKLALANHTDKRTNLRVTVDGLSVGDFQLRPNHSATLERPADAAKQFTFFAAGTEEAAKSGEAGVEHLVKGLVQVAFSPEKVSVKRDILRSHGTHGMGVNSSSRAQGFSSEEKTMANDGPPATMGYSSTSVGAGVTGMTGHSSQTFGVAQPIVEDEDQRVVISLRLVHDKSTTQSDPQPLPGRTMSNPVPPPV